MEYFTKQDKEKLVESIAELQNTVEGKKIKKLRGFVYGNLGSIYKEMLWGSQEESISILLSANSQKRVLQYNSYMFPEKILYAQYLIREKKFSLYDLAKEEIINERYNKGTLDFYIYSKIADIPNIDEKVFLQALYVKSQSKEKYEGQICIDGIKHIIKKEPSMLERYTEQIKAIVVDFLDNQKRMNKKDLDFFEDNSEVLKNLFKEDLPNKIKALFDNEVTVKQNVEKLKLSQIYAENKFVNVGNVTSYDHFNIKERNLLKKSSDEFYCLKFEIDHVRDAKKRKLHVQEYTKCYFAFAKFFQSKGFGFEIHNFLMKEEDGVLKAIFVCKDQKEVNIANDLLTEVVGYMDKLIDRKKKSDYKTWRDDLNEIFMTMTLHLRFENQLTKKEEPKKVLKI